MSGILRNAQKLGLSSTPYGLAPNSGDLLALVVTYKTNTVAEPSTRLVKDNQGNNWTETVHAYQSTPNGGVGAAIFACTACTTTVTACPTFAIGLSGSIAFVNCYYYDITNVVSWTVSATASNEGLFGGGQFDAGTLIPSPLTDIVIAGIGAYDSGGLAGSYVATGTGMVLLDSENTMAALTFSSASSSRIGGPIGSFTPGFSCALMNNATVWAAAACLGIKS